MFGSHTRKHRDELNKVLRELPDCPPSLFSSLAIATGGLTEVGFSRQKPGLLLVISSSGRSVIKCSTGEKLARDYEEYGDWYDPCNLTCLGIGPLSDELISISGLCGGRLPHYGSAGDSLERIASDWPIETLVWCPPGKSALIAGHRQGCLKITLDYLLCAGYSWDGKFIISATSSDITIWQRNLGSGEK